MFKVDNKNTRTTSMRVFLFPGPWSWPLPRPQIVFTGPCPQFVFIGPRPSIRIYWHRLIRIGNNKSQRLHMLLFLFLLSNFFATAIVDRKETKGNLSKNRLTGKNGPFGNLDRHLGISIGLDVGISIGIGNIFFVL